MSYVKGVYMKKKTGKYGEYFVLSFKQEGIDNMQLVEPNAEGFRTFIASPQKENPEKYSVKPFAKKEDAPF